MFYNAEKPDLKIYQDTLINVYYALDNDTMYLK